MGTVSARSGEPRLRRHGANHDVAWLLPDAFEAADAGEIDEVLGRRQTSLHYRDQAVAARQRTRLLAQLRQKYDRFLY